MISSDPLREALVIVSGGQTGADRGALDWAIARGVPHGGWCPRGRLAEDGIIPDRYRLRETPREDYAQRTEWNVRDSDATLIVSIALVLEGGSQLTRVLADRLGKPSLHVTPDACNARQVRAFLARHGVRVLNVAGPRASQEPSAYLFAGRLLDAVFPPAPTTAGSTRYTAMP